MHIYVFMDLCVDTFNIRTKPHIHAQNVVANSAMQRFGDLAIALYHET